MTTYRKSKQVIETSGKLVLGYEMAERALTTSIAISFDIQLVFFHGVHLCFIIFVLINIVHVKY